MERSLLPATAFFDPSGGNAEEVRHLTQQVLESVLTYVTHVSEMPPLPESQPLQLTPLPDTPVSEAELLHHIQQILQASMHAAHPGYIGHMDSMPTTFSVLGDLIASAVNNNMLSLEMSPVFSRLEALLVKHIAALFGLGERANGVLLSGGSLANLQALAVARNIAFSALKQGIAGLAAQPVLFASEVAHTSLLKASMLLGLGTQAVIPVRVNADSQMDVVHLRTQIEQAKADGKLPFCIVATVGTTITGSIDPLPDIAALAREYQLWLHVDAAYGGSLLFSPAQRHRLVGIEQADSITWNPQKWLSIAKTCALVLFREGDQLESAFRVSAPYMKESAFTNLGEISVQGTRHADILKLWLSLQHIGKQGYAQLIDESYRLTAYVVRHVQQLSFLELAGQSDTNLICFRGVPPWLAAEQCDSWNTDLQAFLLREGHIFLSLPLYRGQRWLRVVLLNPYCDESIIDQLFAHIRNFAAKTRPEA